MNTEPWYYTVIAAALLAAGWYGVFYLAMVMS